MFSEVFCGTGQEFDIIFAESIYLNNLFEQIMTKNCNFPKSFPES